MSQSQENEKRASGVFIVIFLIIAIGISFGGYLSYYSFEQQYRTEAEHQLSSIADIKANVLANWRQERLADAEWLHQNVVFSTMVKNYFDHPEDISYKSQIQAWLNWYKVYSDYIRVRLLDSQGQTFLSNTNETPPLSSAIAVHISEVMETKHVTIVDFFRSDIDIDQQIRLALLIPIMDAETDEKVIGLVSITIDPNAYIYPFIKEWPSDSSTAETLIVRQEKNDVLFLNELRFMANSALNLRVSMDHTEILAVKAVMGQTGVVEGLDYQNRSVIGALRAVPNSPWFLVARMDTVEIFAPLGIRTWQTAAIASMAIFAAGAGLLIIWRRMRFQSFRTQIEAAEAIQASEIKYRELVQNANSAIIRYNRDGTILFFNEYSQAFFGYHPEEILGKNINVLIPPTESTGDDLTSLVQNIVDHPEQFETQVNENICRDGHRVWVAWTNKPFFGSNGHVKEILTVGIDITERKRLEEELKQFSIHDALTGLYNYNYFEEELQRFERGRQFPISLVMADVDRLKDVNDTLGHAAGNALLRQVAQILVNSFRSDDIIARIGGDEFAVILPNTDALTANSVLIRVKQSLQLHNDARTGMTIGISFGVNTVTDPKMPLQEALKEADAIMYREKMIHHESYESP